jgi:hypothetical protein
VDRRQSLVEEFPRVPAYQVELANAQEKLARALLRRSEPSAARPLLEQAVSHYRAGLALSPQAAPCGFLSSASWVLADTLLRLGNHREAARVADGLPATCPDHWRECYQAARLLTRCVQMAQQDAPLGEEQRRELVEQYSRRAVELLRAAFRRGYDDLAFVKTDRGLDVLRARDDFKQLLRDLEKPSR